MSWSISLFLSIGVFFLISATGIILRKCKPSVFGGLSLAPVFLLATGVSGYLWILPFRHYTTGSFFEAFVISFQSVFQLFSMDGDYFAFRELLVELGKPYLAVWEIWGTLLYVFGPLCTIGVVLSFFKNLNAVLHFWGAYFKDAYIFSELNEQSLHLAKSCINRNAVAVICDCLSDEERESELKREAERSGIICVKNDMCSTIFRIHGKEKKRYFFVVNKETVETTTQLVSIVSAYKQCENTHLYVFDNTEAGALITGALMAEDVDMTIRRVNPVRSLLYRYFYDNNIFKNAAQQADGSKVMSVALLGLGSYGREFLKMVCWAGQLEGYQLQLHVFDQDEAAYNRLLAEAPELLQKNNCTEPGEAHYQIVFHNMDVFDASLGAVLSELDCVSYAFCALGNELRNIEAATILRRILLRAAPSQAAEIVTVMYAMDHEEITAIAKLTDFKDQDYNITLLSEIEHAWSMEAILPSELEEKAKARHLSWTDRNDDAAVRRDTKKFYKHEYYYRSSMASEIRKKLRIACKIEGAAVPANERTPESRAALRIMEHAGWNAYMRSEGFCYAEKRNDMARQHNLLVPFDQLPLKEQEKDDD